MNTASQNKLPTISEATAILTSPGARYEVEQVIVDGRVVRSWKNIPTSLRSFWLDAKRVYSDSPYIVYERDRFTYSQLHQRACTLASVLSSQYHVRRGDRVAIAMRNCSEWVIAFWACHLVGAVMVAINGWLPAGPLLHCLTSTTAKVIVIDPERAERLTPHLSELKAAPTILLAAAGGREPRPRPGMVSFDAAIDQYRGPEEAWRSEPECSLDDNATIFFTSGTTGLPKGVLSSQRGFMQGYLANNFSRDRYKVTMGLPPVPYPVPSDQVGCMAIASPLMHVAGCTSAMMSATNNGGKVVLMRKWDKEAAAKLYRAEKVTNFGGVPSMVLDLLESSLAGDGGMLTVSFGGAPAASNIPVLAKTSFPNAICSQGYGMTELNAIAIGFMGSHYDANPTSTGFPAPCNEIIVVDVATQRVQPTGQIGELWVRGANAMRGYWLNEAETDKTVTKDGWVKTGDLAYIDDNGLVHICDRVKDMIIRGGENIHSVAVENSIFADERVHEVSVVGVPHRRLGEIVGALVVPKEGLYGKMTEKEVISRCKETLPYFAVPEIVVIQREMIERNAAGKQVKPAVRKIIAAEYARRQTQEELKPKL